MKNKIALLVSLQLLAVVALPSFARAEDEKSNLSGEVEAGGIVGEGLKDSAKSSEYQDRSSGGFGGFTLNYDDKGTGDHGTLRSSNIGREDRSSELSMGRYGEYQADLSYDQIPHNYMDGARTLYSGAGTDKLTLPDGAQSRMQSSTSLADAASRLTEQSKATGQEYNAGILRKTGKAKIEYHGVETVTFRMEASRENREGTQPLMSSFGFGNVTEIINPIDYHTTQARFGVDYATKDLFLSGSYYISSFENANGALTWDNPFRASDSTSPSAYTNPANAVGGGLMNMGSATGRMALAPDNLYHGPTFTASIGDLPFKSRLTMTGALGWMTQDDSFTSYTSNTAVSGNANGSSFNASQSDSLPTQSADAAVSTQMYRVALTSRPTDWLDLGAKYRFYGYDNNTDQIQFPGYVRVDSNWQNSPITNVPVSYTTQTAGADAGIRVTDSSRLGLAYTYKGTARDNSEVNNDSENSIETSISQTVNDWVNFKTSFEKSFKRIGSYDYTAANLDGGDQTQLPLLRKYNQASKDSDEVHFLANMTPSETVDLTGSFLYGQSDYTESDFGLLDDRYYMLSGDVNYAATKWLNLKAFYSFEQHTSREGDRQFYLSGAGDPYTRDTGVSSNSNWGAETVDQIHTVGAGSTVTLISKTLFLDLDYSLSDAHGKVDYSSPLGTAVLNDNNAFDPGSFNELDHTILQRVNAALRYRISKPWSFTVGYVWERFDFGDYTASGYSDVATKSNGDYNGAVMGGTWPYSNYTLNMGYATLKYKF